MSNHLDIPTSQIQEYSLPSSTAIVAVMLAFTTPQSPEVNQPDSDNRSYSSHWLANDYNNTHLTTITKKLSIQLSLYDRVVNKLLGYLDLEDDWDGYGAAPPNEGVIDSAIQYLTLLKEKKLPAPKPMLSGSGEVGLYWDHQNSHFELAFEEQGMFSYFINHGGLIHGEDDIGFDIIPEQLFKGLNEILPTKVA